MAKISPEAKLRYAEKVKEYKKTAEAIVEREKSILKSITDSNTRGTVYKSIAVAEERLNLASYYLLLNRVSVALLNTRNEGFLNDARKSCYQAIIYLEEVVTDYVDVPFSEYEDKLELMEEYGDDRRWYLARKLGFTIQLVKDAFGESSKWKWSFVELEGRYATVVKNLIDLRHVVAGLDPRADGYESRVALVALCKSHLARAADRYRERYELSTGRIDDFKCAISFLSALRRIHALLSENDEAEQVKKKLEVWKSKMSSDEQRAEEQAKDGEIKGRQAQPPPGRR